MVWFEILAQLNLYMTKHAEESRHLFVDFQGQEEIIVQDWTWQSVINSFKAEIQKRVKTYWLEGGGLRRASARAQRTTIRRLQC